MSSGVPESTPKPNSIALSECMSPASYWMPHLLQPGSAWIEHAPFAFWLVEALRPSMIVELGCSTGFSYSAFCQAVQTLSLNCRCYGIDTWQGDQHTGLHGDEIFASINEYNDRHYQSFSRLIRSEFDQALPHFSEQSIDLLHIDGNHTYESTRADYMQWRSRLSRSGVILFHDTNMRERGFGVARLWSELSKEHKHFEFVHGQGLGVLGVGNAFPSSLEALFRSSSEPDAVTQIRLAYSRLGSAIRDRMQCEALQTAQGRIANLELEYANLSKRQNYLSAVLSQREAEFQAVGNGAGIARLDHIIELPLLERKAAIRAQFANAESAIAKRDWIIEQLRREHDLILNSRSWRISASLRRAMTVLRKGAAVTKGKPSRDGNGLV